MWFVYALYNAENRKIYVGQTSDIDRRLIEHNKKRGNHFTSKTSGVWILTYKEVVANRKGALKREKQLKSSRGREFIKQHIPR